ncbi:hypothetical protein DYBT9275_00594 [Dyadobacter sp. CECT 9275]|uniref:NRDE family protein n=1 Tax=Dyadobacter helix TaxID=2822344 RepID=A0A916J9Q6_9BACT|nr:NRDE family protein [Dyadobacter sp. CECT 9275]CAG4990700.1 hypothetical protein DYBT9275_00594 [Dyadobacter sp. CECT 9275]
MCTVSYLPFQDGFILTSSRDEKLTRPPAKLSDPVLYHDQEITFPRDPLGQGSWIATSKTRTVCLLNGAFTAHNPKPPYRHSRGLVVLHAFDYFTIHHFASEYDFGGLEPFTLLLIEDGQLLTLRWTGDQLFKTEKDASRPRIWSSATLYTPEIITRRELWFSQWLHSASGQCLEGIRAFHKTAGEADPENAVCMRRGNQFATVSLTSVVRSDEQTEMIYEDLIRSELTFRKLNQTYVSN